MEGPPPLQIINTVIHVAYGEDKHIYTVNDSGLDSHLDVAQGGFVKDELTSGNQRNRQDGR